LVGYLITCVVLVLVIGAVIAAVRRRRSASQSLDRVTGTSNPGHQAVMSPSRISGSAGSQALLMGRSTSAETNREPTVLIQDAERQVEHSSSTLHQGDLLDVVSSAQAVAPYEARPQVSVPKTDIQIASIQEEEKHSDSTVRRAELSNDPRQTWEAGISTVSKATTTISPPESDVHADAASELGPRPTKPDNGANQWEAIDGHEVSDTCGVHPPTPVDAGTCATPAEHSPNVEALAVQSKLAATATTQNEAEDTTDLDERAVIPPNVGDDARKKQKMTKEIKSRKYEGLSRSAPQPEDTKGQTQHTQSGETNTRDRSLPLAVHLRFDCDGFCTISLIAKRSDGLPEAIVVATRSGPRTPTPRPA